MWALKTSPSMSVAVRSRHDGRNGAGDYLLKILARITDPLRAP